MSCFLFLCLFLPLPLSPSLFLFCLLWYTFSNTVFLFIPCFLVCSPHSFPPSLHLFPVHPPSPPYPTAHCVQGPEEAASPSSSQVSTCGSESSFSPPFCARTSVSSRRLRQVGPGVQVRDCPGYFLLLSYHDLPLPPTTASPPTSTYSVRTRSCCAVFGTG